jgi:hypothetical protein
VTLPETDIRLISKLFVDYIQNTQDGKKTVFKLLNSTVSKPSPLDAYFPLGQVSTITKLDHKDLVRYEGWVYKGTVGLSAQQIEVDKNGGMEACDDTGILGPKDYCVQVVKRYGQGGKEHLVSLSNYARLHSPDPVIRETARRDTCTRCPVSACDYHASRDMRQLPLPKVGA